MTDDAIALAPPLSTAHTREAFLFGGLLLTLVNFAHPAGGLIDIPVTFFLKNRLHSTANELAVFKLWIGTPLFLGFVFGFIRDRWSPLGKGDQAHLLLFGVMTALVYGVTALLNPAYAALLTGLIIATMGFRMVGSAAYGITTTLARTHAVSGRVSSICNFSDAFSDLLSFIGGGLLSQQLEGVNGVTAARIMFWCAAVVMLAIATMGMLGPKWVYQEARSESSAPGTTPRLSRIVRHWPIYPVLLIQLLFQFSPATGTVLQYHIVDHLHASDSQWGLWQGVFFGSFIPVYLIYPLLSRRYALRPLLWVGFGLAVFQVCPLLLAHTVVGAIFAAVPMGLIGGLAAAALLDLVIRSAPPGSQGTMMMLFWALYWLSVRFGDLVGTWIYDRHGGFAPTVWATVIVYALVLPVLVWVPRRLTATRDGEALAI
jgi:MFS family permease